MSQSKLFLALDVGEKRIGVAIGDSGVRIAIPFRTVVVDGSEIDEITRLIVDEKIDVTVIGYPRNQSGEATAQTAFVEAFSDRLAKHVSSIVYQDESLTSVLAEERLQSYGKPYTKADIDAQAAALILQDYLEHL